MKPGGEKKKNQELWQDKKRPALLSLCWTTSSAPHSIRVTRTTRGQRQSEIALQLATNVFWLLKAITKKTTMVVYKVSVLCRALYVPQMSTWRFLLNILVYRISLNLKGTQCLPWEFECRGFTWQQWIQGISHPLCGEVVIILLESGELKSREFKRFAQGQWEIKEYLAPVWCANYYSVALSFIYAFVNHHLFLKAQEDETESLLQKKTGFQYFCCQYVRVLLFF